MSGPSTIEWTDVTWNPVRGCSRVSEGCRNCYAESIAARFSGPGQPFEGLATRSPARWTGDVEFLDGETLKAPMRWKKPRRVFVNSMSDLFHQSLGLSEVAAVFAVIALCPQHTFQILTKRPERAHEILVRRAAEFWNYFDEAVNDLNVHSEPIPVRHPVFERLPRNVWLGVSAENQETANERIPVLLDCPAPLHFVSAEPLLGPIRLGVVVEALDWVIVGGESGPGARPLELGWIRAIVDECRSTGVPCFVKQLGLRQGFRSRKGGDPAEWPEALRVREWPEVRS